MRAAAAGPNLQAALDSISNDILRAPRPDQPAAEGGGAPPAPPAPPASASSSAAAELVEDPEGKPVSCGVLCFDEVQMMDIADSAIVAGVLHRLFDAGWIVIATCNRSPEEIAASTMHQAHSQARFHAVTL